MQYNVINEDFLEKVFALIEEKQKRIKGLFIDLALARSGLQITIHDGEYHARRILDYDTLNTAMNIDPYLIVEYTVNILLHKIHETKQRNVPISSKEDIPSPIS